MKHTYLLAQLVIWSTRKLISCLTYTEHACGDSQKLIPKLDVFKKIKPFECICNLTNWNKYRTFVWLINVLEFQLSLSLFYGSGEAQKNPLSYLAFNNDRCSNSCYSTLYKRFRRVIREKSKNKTNKKTKTKKYKIYTYITLRGLSLLHSVWNLWLSIMLCYKLLISVTALLGCFPSHLFGGIDVSCKDAFMGFSEKGDISYDQCTLLMNQTVDILKSWTTRFQVHGI